MTGTLALILLFVAMSCALWHRPLRWTLGFAVASLAFAALGGLVTPAGLAFAGGGLALAHAAAGAPPSTRRTLMYIGVIALALAAGLHRLPGFAPHPLHESFGRTHVRELLWHYDKGMGGLWLLLLMPRRPATGRVVPTRLLAAGLAGGIAALAGAAWAAGLAQPDPRWQPALPWWLAGNLFLSVIPEEALFRGVMQRELRRMLDHAQAARALAALAFAVVHLPWGPGFAALALVAGWFYGWAYDAGRSLLPAVAAHWLLNAVLVIGFASALG